MKTFCLVIYLSSLGFYFAFTGAGLGYVSVIYDDGSSWLFKKWTYASTTLSNPSIQRFADDSGAGKDKGNILGFIRNGQGADRQFDWFLPDKANRLTQAGLSRLNQSIEALIRVLHSRGTG